MATIEDRYYVRRDGKRVRTDYTGSKRYRVRYRETPQGKVKAQSFERKTDAEEFMVSLAHNLRAGTYVDPAKGRQTFGSYWTSFRSSRVDLRASSVARDESYYRNHIEPRFGDVALSSIDRKMLREWVAELVAKGLAPKTVRHHFNLVSQTLDEAAAEPLIASNPAAGMKGLPKVVTTEMRFLTPDEVATLEEVMDKRYRVWLRTAVGSGLRLGELGALRAERVDVMRRRVTVAENLGDVRGALSFGEPKTKAGRRVVPITPQLAGRLTDHLAGRGPRDLLFTAPDGGPMRASLFRRRTWQPACIAAGLGAMVPVDPDDPEGPARYEGLRIHDLRHTAVSWWIAAGADVKQIAVWAGHSSVATVLDRYGHLLPDREDGVMDALGALEGTGKATTADVVELRPNADEDAV